MKSLILLLTATSTALIAGLFYAWSCSVTPGLARLSHAEYLAAMQSINRAIQNPVFFASFLGTALCLPLSTYLSYDASLSLRFWLLLAATLVYLIGGLGVTVFGNVPLNEALDTFSLSTASPQELVAQRLRFEIPWNRLHTARTIACLVSLVLVLVACLYTTDR